MTLPESKVAGFVLLPELKITHFGADGLWLCEKRSEFEVCPRCATPSHSIYDHRWVNVRDEPLRGHRLTLRILKRRFACKTCRRPFTEPIPGVIPGRRTTQRFRLAVMEACERYTDLSSVRKEFRVSSHFIYDAYYERLKLNLREREGAPWPAMIGMDEHAYGKNKEFRRTQFVTTIVDHGKGKMFEAIIGKTQAELEAATRHIPGRENVQWATIDMCDPYRNFIRSFFPNAKIVADKFHVLRLLTPALLRKRKEISGTRADLRAKKLLLMSAKNLRYEERLALDRFLVRYPEMRELYGWKERLHSFYRMRGGGRSYQAYKKLMDDMSVSFLPEVITLRKTLLKWKDEILNYFYCRLTNARLEGFNCKASALKRRAYGYRNPENYRIQLLHACSR
jgi:transposase